MTIEQPDHPLTVTFKCSGKATGKMRNDLDVHMVEPIEEHFTRLQTKAPFTEVMPPPRHLWHFSSGA